MGQDNCKPQPGDLIEIDRTRHKHWALYVGDGYVINLTPVGKKHLKLGIHTVPVFIRRVKKQRLEEVVQNNTWCVNNKSDQCHRPLPLTEIICRAKDYIDKDFTYRVFGSNCEYFVKKLRYGERVSDQRRDFVCGEMHLQDMTDDKDYPNPGDLIEICRPGYQHWALYLGKGYVIHVTNDGGAQSVFASSGSVLSRKAKVKKELLKDVAQNDAWDVNNKYDHCRMPFPMEEIIQRAEQWIGKELPYRLFFKNCEHFVTMLRYGEGVSDQAMKALENGHKISTAVTLGLSAAGLAVPTGALVVAAGVGLLACIGTASSNIAYIMASPKFEKVGRDILEQSCC